MPFVLTLTALIALTGSPTEPYRWKNVAMVGAGFVDGIVCHPRAKDVRYARTDMGGAYRWSARARRWEPILDWVPFRNLNWMGVESIALDPTDPRRVYLACGTYTNPTTPDGAILRSTDQGRTWKATPVPFKFGGNENGRGNGERMAVDPRDPRRLYLGTRHAGLWTSANHGETWTKLDAFPWPNPAPARSADLVVVAIDPTTTPNSTVYVAASTPETSIFRSRDEGRSWEAVPGQPKGLMPTHMVRGDDGALWITYGSSPGPTPMTNGAVWKYLPKSETWRDVTPDRPDETRRFGYVAASVQSGEPNTAIVSTFFRPSGEQIFRTRDGGTTWKPIIGGRETYDNTKAPYVNRVGIHWLFDIEIDPHNPNHAMFTTGYGGHETHNLTDADLGKPVKWTPLGVGIEESVALTLVSPKRGAHLISGIGDYGGFVHRDLDRPAPEGNFVNPHFGNTDSIGVAANAPETIVRVGRASNFDVRVNIGYSKDGGKTWKPATLPTANAISGTIAVGADGTAWVWSLRNGSFVTSDEGATWKPCQGLPSGLRVVADTSDPRKFYALALFEGQLYRSTDAGRTFTASRFGLEGGLPRRGGDRMDSRAGQDQLYVTPDRKGDLWIAAFDGLHHSTDDGATWKRMPAVRELHAFGFGKAAPGRRDPALYLVGTANGQRGIFRSIDFGRSWVRINDDAHQWGLVLLITGDPKRYGRVYVGTHGRGTFYGDPR